VVIEYSRSGTTWRSPSPLSSSQVLAPTFLVTGYHLSPPVYACIIMMMHALSHHHLRPWWLLWIYLIVGLVACQFRSAALCSRGTARPRSNPASTHPAARSTSASSRRWPAAPAPAPPAGCSRGVGEPGWARARWEIADAATRSHTATRTVFRPARPFAGRAFCAVPADTHQPSEMTKETQSLPGHDLTTKLEMNKAIQ
jgi:hypothetical protein